MPAASLFIKGIASQLISFHKCLTYSKKKQKNTV